MHKLKDNIKGKLYDIEEKVERNPKAEMSLQELQKVQLMSDIVKNIDKIEMLEDGEGYSEDGHYMGEGRIYGTSYARGRRYAKRDSMGGRGGYSRDNAAEMLMEKAEEMLEMTDDPKERKAIEKFMRELED